MSKDNDFTECIKSIDMEHLIYDTTKEYSCSYCLDENGNSHKVNTDFLGKYED